jgi:GAF domain-containing protein
VTAAGPGVPGGESVARKARAADGLRRIAEEQAALRRVAVLAVQGEAPEEIFAAVAAEAGQVLDAEHAFIGRYDPDGTLEVIAAWTSAAAALIAVGTRFSTGGRNLITLVLQTGRPARLDEYFSATGATATFVRESGIRATVGAPVSVEGQLWGLMAVASEEKPLPAGTEERLAAFTELAATAIANAQAREELRGFAAEQAALRRVAVLVAGGATPEEVFAAVTEEAAQVLGAAATSLARYDPDGAETVVGRWTGTSPAAPIPVGFRKALGGRNVSTLVFETGRPARIDDYTDSSGELAKIPRESGTRAMAGVPVRVEGRLWGVLLVSSRLGPLPADTEERLVAFTELAATAIANAQAREELRGFAAEQAALRRVAVLVARGATPEEVFAAVTEEAARALGAAVMTLARYDPDGAETVVGAWIDTTAHVLVPIGTRKALGGRNVSTLVFETGRPARINDYADSSGEVGKISRESGTRAAVGAPVSVEGHLWGVLIVSSPLEPLPAGTEARLVAFTELAATAIANAQARAELRSFAAEQAALRRVAVLVARGAPPEEVFAAVAEEAGRLLGTEYAWVARYDPEGTETVGGAWAGTGGAVPIPVGSRIDLGGRNVATLVFQTGRPARIDDYTDYSGEVGKRSHEAGLRAGVGAPIRVEGRLWGVISVASSRRPLPGGTEERLAGFTELTATAIANAEAQAALAASRVRVVAAGDAARRRIERDLHDGAQQRLVSLALQLRATQAAAPEAGELASRLDIAVTEVNGVLDELREIARGIHPAVLTSGGLRQALKALARRSAVPVSLDVQVTGRLPESAEIAIYYVVAEALTNTAKHTDASIIDVQVESGEGEVHVCVRDDGRGGAHVGGGSGLAGLKDRVEALGGRFSLDSPPGGGTALDIVLPLGDRQARSSPLGDQPFA